MTDINWDTNRDGKFGTPKLDIVDYIPVINVSRIPLQTIYEIENYVKRIIMYEQNPQFKTSFLQMGARLENKVDGYNLANLLYQDVFENKIAVESLKFFDSFTYNGNTFNSSNINSELTKGYQFVEIISHGTRNSFNLQNNRIFYGSVNAMTFSNEGQTFITTTACETNMFDTEMYDSTADPCISEVFLRNPNSGIIGYWGSSRFGWHYKFAETLELSMAYEREFYERLMNTSTHRPYEKNFASLVNFVKRSMIGQLEDPVYRWLHYSLNPLGDPETPIFNCYPFSFSSAKAIVDDKGILKIETGVNNARICVTSSNQPNFYVVDYGDEFEIPLKDGKYDIWITKQNYIPKHLNAEYEYLVVEPIESKILSITPNPTSSYTTITYQSAVIGGSLRILLTNTNMLLSQYEYDVASPNGEITIDTSKFPAGIYLVSLVMNGSVVDSSQKLVKQ